MVDVEVTFDGVETPFVPGAAPPRTRRLERPARADDGDREPGVGQRAYCDERGWPVAGEVMVEDPRPVKCLDCPKLLTSRGSIRRGRGPVCERRHRAGRKP